MGRVFLGVKNNSKNFGNKKNIRLLLAKFSVNRHCFSEKCRIFGVFMSNGLVKNRKLFLYVIKVHIYAYAHINIKYFDFLNDI